MKIVIEYPKKLTDNDLEEIVDVWNRNSRRIAVSTLIQTLISLHMHMHTLTAHAYSHCSCILSLLMHTLTAHALCQALNIVMNLNIAISKGGGGGGGKKVL